MLTDVELETLLKNAKPAHNKSLGFAWSNYGQFCTRPYYLSFVLFQLLSGGTRYQQHYMCYPNESAAMDALQEAVKQYKDNRTDAPLLEERDCFTARISRGNRNGRRVYTLWINGASIVDTDTFAECRRVLVACALTAEASKEESHPCQ